MPDTITDTPYGRVIEYGDSASVTVSATEYEIYAWSHRHNAHWPCSTLERLPDLHNPHSNLTTPAISVDIDGTGDLVGITTEGHDREHVAQCEHCQRGDYCDDISADIDGNELTAWSSDVLEMVLPDFHPIAQSIADRRGI